MRRFHVVAVDGVGQRKLHVRRKRERAGGLCGVSQSECKVENTHLDGVEHEFVELGSAMMTGAVPALDESCREACQSSHLESRLSRPTLI